MTQVVPHHKSEYPDDSQQRRGRVGRTEDKLLEVKNQSTSRAMVWPAFVCGEQRRGLPHLLALLAQHRLCLSEKLSSD